jgi:hypothetical protein
MVKTPAFNFNVTLGFDMARGTTTHSTRNAFLLLPLSSLIKMTDKTVRFVNREVCPLNDLGMACGASNSHPSSQLAQMLSMGKAYILIYHVTSDFFLFVTPLLQAVTIIHLVMKFFDASTNNDVSQRELEIDRFSFEMIQNTRFSVTTQTAHLVM